MGLINLIKKVFENIIFYKNFIIVKNNSVITMKNNS